MDTDNERKEENKLVLSKINKIPQFQLEKIKLNEEFDVVQVVGEGWFGKILLVDHKSTDKELVLKALPKQYIPINDFYREFHYSLHLGKHKNIVSTYNIAFETEQYYLFSQEYASLGDLTSNVSENGIGELYTKRVAKQLANAIEYIHEQNLVHRDVKLDNILVFRSDFSKIKLCDLGEARKVDTLVHRRNEWLPYAPPEVLSVDSECTYRAHPSHDVWQFAIVLFVCLTGCLPWQKASSDDPRYMSYIHWHGSNGVLMHVRRPKLFKLLSSKAQRIMKKFLEPNIEKRPSNFEDLTRSVSERWLDKSIMNKNTERETDNALSPSMYSYHSSVEEKNKLLRVLTEYGIETTVDRSAKKVRIQQWIQNSVIEESDEDYESEEEMKNVNKGKRQYTPSSSNTSGSYGHFSFSSSSASN